MLEIYNFRGIRHIKIEPDGNNFLIWGPNGSGKSTVVDGIDFLLTGQISRIKSNEASLKRYGPHVDYSESESIVRAIIKIHVLDEPIEIERHLDNPEKLICDDSIKDIIEPVLRLAKRGQYILTRREILDYVNSQSNKRGEQIQTLLKITDVEETRDMLIKTKNVLYNHHITAKNSLETISSTITANLEIKNFNEDKILTYVNENRKILDGTPLKELKSIEIKNGIKIANVYGKNNLNIQVLKNNINKVQQIISNENKDGIVGKLDKINQLSDEINQLYAILSEIIRCTEVLGLDDVGDALDKWSEGLKQLISAVSGENDTIQVLNVGKVGDIVSPAHMPVVLDKIYSAAIEKSEEPSKEQTAWDNLTRLEENLKNYEKSLDNYSNTFKAYNKSSILLNTFLNAHNLVLDRLYGKIKDRFIGLYRDLHGVDEIGFDATMVSKGAGVDLEVDFHGRGLNPPHALHSEGHQDSMGICLYLALAEKLTQGYIDMIILDDVMMSVDAPHRREICHILAEDFEGRQFFITTHDQTWSRELQSEGVIETKNKIELSNWTIDNGPSVNTMDDIWDAIEEDLKRNDIPSAAAKLRRTSEEYFSQVCASLHAPVRFQFNCQYELGDLLSGAMSEYKSQLKHAKSAARSWENYEELERLTKIEKFSKRVFSRLNMEIWAVNPALHYNQWADFTPQDFKPVVETFHDLFSIFQCSKCGTLLHLVINGPRPEAVKCNCGNITWNLKDK